MQQATYKTELLTITNIDQIKEIYESFRLKATKDYRYEIEPLDFYSFKESIEDGRLKGIALFDDSQPEGILIFVVEPHKAIELNIIHVPNRKDINKKRFSSNRRASRAFKDTVGLESYKLSTSWLSRNLY